MAEGAVLDAGLPAALAAADPAAPEPAGDDLRLHPKARITVVAKQSATSLVATSRDGFGILRTLHCQSRRAQVRAGQSRDHGEPTQKGTCSNGVVFGFGRRG
jgi:hypothetical protein